MDGDAISNQPSAPPSGAGAPARVGPRPAPPPERLDTWTVLDLLATARRWRVNEPFVAGQIDGLSRALVACLNAEQAMPRWLRETLLAFLLEVLWEQPRPAGRDAGAQQIAEWDAALAGLLRCWREPVRGHGPLR